MSPEILCDQLIQSGHLTEGKRQLCLARDDYRHLWASQAAAKGLLESEDVPPKPKRRQGTPPPSCLHLRAELRDEGDRPVTIETEAPT